MRKTSPPIGCVDLASTVGVHLWSMCICLFVRMHTLWELCASQGAFASCQLEGELKAHRRCQSVLLLHSIALNNWGGFLMICASQAGGSIIKQVFLGDAGCVCVCAKLPNGFSSLNWDGRPLIWRSKSCKWTGQIMTIDDNIWPLYTHVGQWRQFASSILIPFCIYNNFGWGSQGWIFPKSCVIPELQYTIPDEIKASKPLWILASELSWLRSAVEDLGAHAKCARVSDHMQWRRPWQNEPSSHSWPSLNQQARLEPKWASLVHNYSGRIDQDYWIVGLSTANPWSLSFSIFQLPGGACSKKIE